MGATIYKDGKVLADVLQLSAAPGAVVSVGQTSTVVLNANVLRKYVRIANLSATYPVFLAFGEPAVANQGIFLGMVPAANQPGGVWTMLCKDFMFTGAINGISVGGSSNVSVMEGT